MNSAIFIISHERADRVETYETLRNSGYTGDLYVVIDNEDSMLPAYQDRFSDALLVFDKQFYIDNTDTLENDKLRASPVYARHAVEDYAQQMNLDAFGMFDDDVKNLRYRWREADTIRSITLTKNLDTVFQMYFQFILDTDIATTSFANVLLYIGGVDGIESRISNNREMYQIHLRNSKFPYEWKSVVNDDAVTELSYHRQGYMLWSLPFIVFDSPKMNTLPGGMKTVYDSVSEFRRAFLATVAVPGVCKPVLSKGHWVVGRNKKACYPCIVSSRYKK